MGLKFSDLYAAPGVNPANYKARAIPFLNPIKLYGRVFFFCWFGFMIAFWAWYTFPPLVRQNPQISLHIPLSPQTCHVFMFSGANSCSLPAVDGHY